MSVRSKVIAEALAAVTAFEVVNSRKLTENERQLFAIAYITGMADELKKSTNSLVELQKEINAELDKCPPTASHTI